MVENYRFFRWWGAVQMRCGALEHQVSAVDVTAFVAVRA